METEKLYVTVPKTCRDKARKYGALFDPETHMWYITTDCRYKRLFEPVELFVDFSKKDEAKQDGAFYNKHTKKWYALRLQKELIEKYSLSLSEDEDDPDYIFSLPPK